jgi:hypothetical protein
MRTLSKNEAVVCLYHYANGKNLMFIVSATKYYWVWRIEHANQFSSKELSGFYEETDGKIGNFAKLYV